jgi:hypothetical protein
VCRCGEHRGSHTVGGSRGSRWDFGTRHYIGAAAHRDNLSGPSLAALYGRCECSRLVSHTTTPHEHAPDHLAWAVVRLPARRRGAGQARSAARSAPPTHPRAVDRQSDGGRGSRKRTLEGPVPHVDMPSRHPAPRAGSALWLFFALGASVMCSRRPLQPRDQAASHGSRGRCARRLGRGGTRAFAGATGSGTEINQIGRITTSPQPSPPQDMADQAAQGAIFGGSRRKF